MPEASRSSDSAYEPEFGPDAWLQLRQWLDDARDSGSAWASVMILATSTAEGHPSARAVVVRDLDESGLAFDSDDRSRKAEELAHNPLAAGVLLWPELQRQVRAEGDVTPVPAGESNRRFEAVPRQQQLAIWASHQSEPIADLDELRRRIEQLEVRYRGRSVPRPSHWGGYRLRPTTIEFWQGRDDRLHDRFLYRRQPDGGWTTQRLSP